MTNKPFLAITMGDAAGIGPEVVAKTLIDANIYEKCRPFVIGNAEAMSEALKLIGSDVSVEKVVSIKDIKTNLLNKIISSINFEAPFSLVTDYLHKFSIGDNIAISNELGDLNIKQCIIEYIESHDNKSWIRTQLQWIRELL